MSEAVDSRRLVHAVQVAGVHDRAEAEAVIAAGADFIGLPLRLRDGREDLSEAAARDLFRDLRGRVQRVLITYLEDAPALLRFAEEIGCDWVQLHAAASADLARTLRTERPGLGLIQALVVGADDVERAVDDCTPWVDAFITDTFDPVRGRRGATGLRHDWGVSRRIVERSERPVILAGGLGPDDVGKAIEATGAVAVDAHTRLEGPDGQKDPALVARFVDEARRAFRGAARRRAESEQERS